MSYGGNNSTKVITTGPGLGTLLTIAFIILKLCGVITWSWFWVLSPLIFTIALILIATVIILILVIRFNRTSNNLKRKREAE